MKRNLMIQKSSHPLPLKRREDGYIVGDVIVNLDIESECLEIKRIAFREKRKR